MASVLSKHMGESFNRLAPLLREVHDGKQRIYGTAQVKRGNYLARFICTLFRFPQENPRSNLHVDCEHTDNAMIWKRNFDGLQMESHFVHQGNYLVEHLGPLALSFTAQEQDGALYYQFVRTRLWGIPLPDFLSPKVVAFEAEAAGRYRFSVEVRMFLVGMVIAYAGELELVRNT